MLKRLAVGGMAELYLAKDTRTDRMVVLKRILPYLAEEDEFVHMFLDEARIAASLHHPNVVEVIELGERDGSIFIAMEWVNGIDLRRVLQIERERSGVVPPGIAAWIVARLCEGLYYAHVRTADDGTPLGIIHRDVSPQNVMLSFRGDVKLVDFGIAKASAWMTRSKPGVIKGKFLYLAPEQLSQERADLRADLFSVGTLLYELTTGKSPFFRSTGEEVIYAIRMEEAEAPLHQRPGFPVTLSRVIMKCLQKDRTRRYQTADEVRAALDDFMRVDAPTTRADVARYLSTLFGDEEERTSVFIPPNAQSPLGSSSPPAVTDPSRTEPMRTEPRGAAPPGLEAFTAHTASAEQQDLTADMSGLSDDATASMSQPKAHLGDDDADIPPTAVSVSGARDVRVGEILPALLPERFELDEVTTHDDAPGRRPPPPPVPSSDSLPEVKSVYSVAEEPQGYLPPARPPPLPKKPPRAPPVRAATKPPPPIETPEPQPRPPPQRAPAPRPPPSKRKLPPVDPDDLVATVDLPERDVERRSRRKPAKPDRRGQNVLLGIIGVSLVVVVVLLVMVLWPRPHRGPPVVTIAPAQVGAPPDDSAPPSRAPTRIALKKVKVSIRSPRASRVAADGALVVNDAFEHVPGPTQLSWQCPPGKKKGKPTEHARTFEVPPTGPALFELACPP